MLNNYRYTLCRHYITVYGLIFLRFPVVNDQPNYTIRVLFLSMRPDKASLSFISKDDATKLYMSLNLFAS